MDLTKIFIFNLKKWRKKRGMTQKILAEKCNKAPAYLRQIESGVRTPSFALIGTLSEALGVDAAELFHTENKKPANNETLEKMKVEIIAELSRSIDRLIGEAQK
jgi:transcriptional regulator with XRE-family HTH domain